MNALALCHDLKNRCVVLKADGDSLKVDVPAGELTEEDRAALIEFKLALLRFLSRRTVEEPMRRSRARWAGPGLIRILDPFTGEWHEWPSSKCLPGVLAEADKYRKKGAGA